MKLRATLRELELAKNLGESRHQAARDKKVKDRWCGQGGFDSIETDVRAALCEVVICRLVGGVHNIAIGKSDGGADVLIPGRRIDVKYTYHPDGNLLVKLWDVPRSDLFILCTLPAKDEVEIKGVISKANVEKYGYSMMAVPGKEDLVKVEAKHLRPMEEFLDWLEDYKSALKERYDPTYNDP